MARHYRGQKTRRKSSNDGDMVLWFGDQRGVRLRDLTFDYVCTQLTEWPVKSPEWWVFQGELKRRERLREYTADYAAITDRGNGRKRRGSPEVVRRKAEDLRENIGVDMGQSLAGQQSPWGVCYPESWGMMSSREQREWKLRESANFAKRPLGEKIAQAVSNSVKHTPVKPAIPSAMDLADQQKRANVAMAAKTIRQPTEPIQADECPY